jgi:hypothetical protein
MMGRVTMSIPSLRFPATLARSALAVVLVWIAARVATAESTEAADAAYTRTITQRADKIVKELELRDPETAAPLRDLLVEQYRALHGIHKGRDAASDAKVSEGESVLAAKLVARHRRFVAELSALLSPAEVDRVKDALTYGVVPITYRRYCELLPDLSGVERREVLAQLLEAREIAMDGGSSEEKHAIFGKYKGRINNYLSKAGYDLKQAETQWTARHNAAANSNAASSVQ